MSRGCHVAASHLPKHMRTTHAPIARVMRREKTKLDKRGHVALRDWLFGFLLSLCFGLNYFIANNFILFFTKIHDFFSLQIETWII